MAMKILPDLRLLLQILAYDPGTGEFAHLARPQSMFPCPRIARSWNARYAGTSAGGSHGGYWQIIVGNRKYRAHRIAFKMYHGRDPEHEIDHINGNPMDNRICNLREATSSQQKCNSKTRAGTATGVKGVARAGNRYRAYIKQGGEYRYLGGYETLDEAVSARRAAEAAWHGEYARTTDTRTAPTPNEARP